MAAINSHRKRQVYHQHLSRRAYGYYSGNQAPAGAATIMPDKGVSADTYYAGRRQFAELSTMLNNKYLGGTLQTLSSRDTNGNRTILDVIKTTPAAFVNPNSSHNPLRYQYSSLSKASFPLIYSVEVSAAGGYTGYSRRNTGLLLNGHTSYKGVKIGNGNQGSNKYMQVISLADMFGGNIKSRATLLKWVGGMWRAK